MGDAGKGKFNQNDPRSHRQCGKVSSGQSGKRPVAVGWIRSPAPASLRASLFSRLAIVEGCALSRAAVRTPFLTPKNSHKLPSHNHLRAERHLPKLDVLMAFWASDRGFRCGSSVVLGLWIPSGSAQLARRRRLGRVLPATSPVNKPRGTDGSLTPLCSGGLIGDSILRPLRLGAPALGLGDRLGRVEQALLRALMGRSRS